MFSSTNKVAHTEVIDLAVSPEQVRDFIMTPERILDYYPDPIEGGVITAGASIYCRGKAGVSLLEVLPEESSDELVVVKVTTALKLKAPFTEERIRAAVFFTMIEDWALTETDQGTRLTKTWRDIKKAKLKFMPMGTIVRKSAIKESHKLRQSWNQQAR